MSSYKIYAKKGKKVMPIKIEEKHIYQHTATNQDLYLSVIKSVTNPTFPRYYRGYAPTDANCKLLHNTNTIAITQGTTEDQRIGNKVNIKSVSLVLNLHINPTPLINDFGHSELVDMKFHFRLMCVKFNSPLPTTSTGGEPEEFAKWYRSTFIYYRTVSVSGDANMPVQSNWMDKMRNSTEYTGSFKILYDKKFSLSKFKTVKQKQINLPIKGNATFDNTNNLLSPNQGLSNIYTFLIGPSNNWLDMDAISTDKAEHLSTGYANLFIYNANIKTIYYDV